MRIQDTLYYAPDITITSLLVYRPNEIIDAFESRITNYYLKPADILNRNRMAFGAGDLIFDAIDAIARYELDNSMVGERFKKWISRLPDFKELVLEELERVYDEFRNGVTHEARIKNGGQFTYDINKAVEIKKGIVLVNPKVLLDQVSDEFKRSISFIKDNEKEQTRISKQIKGDLRKDLERVEIDLTNDM
jgi:hypothetical protein